MIETVKETAKCRGCGKQLIGESYHRGRSAYDPKTKERARINFYGGFVCCRSCDIRACLHMSSSMPGAGQAKFLNSLERDQVETNWEEPYEPNRST